MIRITVELIILEQSSEEVVVTENPQSYEQFSE